MARKSQKRKRAQLIREMQKEQSQARLLKEARESQIPDPEPEETFEATPRSRPKIKRPARVKKPKSSTKSYGGFGGFGGFGFEGFGDDFEDFVDPYADLDPQKLADMLAASRKSLQATTQQMLDQLDPTAQAYLLLTDKLEERRKKIKTELGAKVSGFTKEVDNKLRNIVEESKDANLKQLRQHAKRISDIRSIVESGEGKITPEERQHLEESLQDVTKQIQTRSKQESSVLGRAGKALGSQGFTMGAVIAGAFADNPIMTFIGGAVADFIKTSKEERQQLIKERVQEMADLREILQKQTDNLSSKFDSSKTDELLSEMVFEQKNIRETAEKSFEFDKESQHKEDRQKTIDEKMQRLRTPEFLNFDKREKEDKSITERLIQFMMARSALATVSNVASNAAGTAIGTTAAGGSALLAYLLRKKIPGAALLAKYFTKSGAQLALPFAQTATKTASKTFGRKLLSKVPYVGLGLEAMDIGQHIQKEDSLMGGIGNYLGGKDHQTGERRSIFYNVLDKAGTGAMAGGMVGTAFGGIGAGPGALIGGIIGGVTGLVSSLMGEMNDDDDNKTKFNTAELVDHNGKQIGEPIFDELQTSNELLEIISDRLEENAKRENMSRMSQLSQYVQHDPILGSMGRVVETMFSKVSDIFAGKPTKKEQSKQESNREQIKAAAKMIPGTIGLSSIDTTRKEWTKQASAAGLISQKHETGQSDPIKAASTISSGAGDFGGKSYGAHQLASKTGTLQKFLKDSGYDAAFGELQPGSESFDRKWKEMAQDSNFRDAQKTFIAKTHYQPLVNRLEKSGININKRSQAIQEMLHSIGTQYGERLGSQMVKEALAEVDTEQMSDAELINQVQTHRGESVEKYFPSSSPNVRAGVKKRADREKRDLLAMVHNERQNLHETSQKLAMNQSQPTVINNVIPQQNTNSNMGNTMVEGNAPSSMGITRNPESIYHSLIKTQYWFSAI